MSAAQPIRTPRGRWNPLVIAAAAALSACGTAAVVPAGDPYAGVDGGPSVAIENDPTLIVDCLLPGRIKKLGAALTYVTPRRAVKSSSMECEIRGGEYVAYDRANYQTALKIWLPQAEQGDPAAQTYVGAIYEKGLGVDPDYERAARWYRQAAEQGYARAQYALGYLLETGQGVGADPQAALSWYRKAAGVTEADLELTRIEMTEAEKARLAQATAEERARLEEVSGQVDAQQQTLARLTGELQAAREKLRAQRAAIERQDAQLAPDLARAEALEKRIAAAQRQMAALDGQLEAKQQALFNARLELAERQDAVSRSGARLQTLRQEIADQQAQLQNRQQQLTGSADQPAIAALEDEIARKQRQLADVEGALAQQKQLAGESGQELLALLKQVEERKSGLQKELQQLAADRQAAAEQRAQLERERQALASQWSAAQQEKVRQLEQQQAVVARLEQRQEQNQMQLAALEMRADQSELLAAAPRIELIDPLVPSVRSGPQPKPVLKVHAGATERQIVGKVQSPLDLLAVTVNDRPVSVQPGGVFNTSVTLFENGTQVDVVAVDVQGNRAQRSFVIVPEQAARSVAAGSSEDTVEEVAAVIPDVAFGNYYALLIGNNAYTHLPRLLTPRNDVDAVAKELRERYGFKETTILHDATRYDIITALNRLRQQLTDKDNLLIYYAGHGELDRVNMTGQWLPVDAEPENTANWISNSALTELVNAIPAKRVLVVADSCYSGIMTRSALTSLAAGQSQEARLTWLRKMAEKRSRTVLTSGGVAPVMDEGGGDHSVFARAFLDALRSNKDVLEGQRLFRMVSASVALIADRYRVDQVPEYAPIRHAGHESGDFFLVPGRRS